MNDPEYNRLCGLAKIAHERGDLAACLLYQRAAIRRGDEMLASMGSSFRLMPLVDAVDALIDTKRHP